MSSNQSQSDNDAPVQISLKTNPQKTKQITKTRKSILPKKDPNNKIASLKKKLKSELKKQFQQQKIRQQLEQMPLYLGRNNVYSELNQNQRKNQIIKIQDTVQERKKIRGLGLQLVQMNRRVVRKPQGRLLLQLDTNNRMRGNFQQILSRKKSKR